MLLLLLLFEISALLLGSCRCLGVFCKARMAMQQLVTVPWRRVSPPLVVASCPSWLRKYVSSYVCGTKSASSPTGSPPLILPESDWNTLIAL